jgi:hypothetical protein
MPKNITTTAAYRRLSRLSRRLSGALGFDSIPMSRDPVSGAFTNKRTVTGRSLRVAWRASRGRADGGRDAFKAQLLAALRAPRK